MRFFLFFLVALSLGFVAEGKVWAVIDTFATNVPPLFETVDTQDYDPPFIWYSPYGESAGLLPAVLFTNTNDCLGGQRDLILGHQSDSASGSLAVMGVSQQSASIGFPLEYNGGAYFQWDGIDNAGSTEPFPGANLNAQPGIGSANNPFGLSGGRMDFTFGGRAQGITMTVLADHEVFYYYDALDSFGTKNTLQNFVVPINDTTPVVLNVTFADPRWNRTSASAFSWTNVVAFQVRAITFSDEAGFSQAVDTSFKFLNITGYEIAGFVVVDCLCTGDNANPQAGVSIQLFQNTASQAINTTVTDANGNFAFYGYGPGNYRVCVDAGLNRCSNSPQCVSFTQDNDFDFPLIRFAATVTTTLSIPADRTVECGACTTPECLGFANVTSCNGFQQLSTWNDSQTTSGCTTTIRRTWTSPDNTRSGTQTITVRDTQAPVITTPAQNLTQPCGSSSTSIDQWLSVQANAQATDCSLFSWTNDYNNNGPVQCGAVTVTFFARDVCGLQTPTTAVFTILDNQPPVVLPASDSSAECDTKGQTDQQQFTTWLNNRGGASATDVCDSSVSASNNNTGTLTSGCDQRRTVQFTFSDDCGNSDFTVATFFIRDTTAPVITREAQPASGSCTGNSNAALSTFLNTHGGSTASDNCIANDANLVWTNDYVNGSITGGCSGGVPVTFTVTDPCGLTATTVASFTISDTTPPTITRQASPILQECGTGADLQSSYNAWLANNGGATATDDCTGVTWTNNGTDVTPQNGCLNVYTVVFSARDGCNAQAVSTTSTFTVRDTTAPSFTTNPQNQQAECNSGVTAAFNSWLASAGGAVGADSCGAVTITNDFTGSTPALGCNVVTPVRFTVQDSCGLSSPAFTANFTVTDTTPPTIDVQAQPTAVECNSTTNQQSYAAFLSARGGAQASDICSSTVTWSNNGTSAITSGCNVVRFVQFTATDGCGRQASTVTTFTVQDTTAPVLTRAAADQTAECNGNTGNSAAFNSWRSSHGGATAVDNCGAITWTDNFVAFSNDSTQCTSSATVTFTASDPCGFSVSTVATYSVTDTVGPSISTPAQNQVVQCDGTGNTNQFQTFLDNHGGAVAVDACTGSTNLVWTNEVASSPQGCGTSQVTFIVADPCGRTARTTASFTVSDSTNPTFSTPPSSPRVECDGNGNTNEYQQWVSTFGGAVAGDVCATVVSLSSNAPQTGPTGCGVVPATITATDNCNNAAQVTASFTVIDTQPPVFTQQAADSSVECDGTSNQAALNNWLSTYGGAVATDVCYGSQSLSWTNNYTTITQSGCNRSARVQFTVTDPCGQRATTVATFSITDSTPPVITQPANSTVLECNLGTNAQSVNTYIASRGGATATDTCSGVTWTNDYSTSNPPVACQAPVVVTFRATDACGNVATTTGSIAIVDSDGPRFVSFPADIRLNCSDSTDSSVTGFPTVSDVCDNAVDIVQSDSTVINPDERLCPGDTIITRTFTATDACGNQISRTQTITQGIPVGTCIPTQCPPCNQTQFCCASSLVSPPCIPVACNPVPCSSVECNPVPCLPVTCDGTPPVYNDDDDDIPPSPTPQNPECEPIYIYVFDDEDNDSDTQVQQPRSSSDASMLGFSLFALFLVVVALF